MADPGESPVAASLRILETSVLEPAEGMGLELMKCHVVNHMADDISKFGVNLMTDNISKIGDNLMTDITMGPKELHHKPTKSSAKQI